MKLTPKNWHAFQHYKDRNPPWIKVHKSLLDDRGYQRLPLASRALAPMLWLLASEHEDGVFDASLDELTFRLRQPNEEIAQGLQPLVAAGFFEVVDGDAISVLADCQRLAVPEKRQRRDREETEQRERERERERWKPGFLAHSLVAKSPASQIARMMKFAACGVRSCRMPSSHALGTDRALMTSSDAGVKTPNARTWTGGPVCSTTSRPQTF